MKIRNRHKPSLRKSPVVDVYNLIPKDRQPAKINLKILGTAYARCILYEKIYGRGTMDWKAMNVKLIESFSVNGLETIKKEAWKILEEEAKTFSKEETKEEK